MKKVKEFYEVNSPIDPKWGEVLRYLRNRKGYSLREAGAKIDISNVFVHKLETAQCPIKQPILYLLLKCYGSSLFEFFHLLNSQELPSTTLSKSKRK